MPRLSPLKLCVRFPLMARCTLYIFIMFMLSSFRDLLQVSGFIDIPVSFTILNHHLIHVGNILLQVMLSTINVSNLPWRGPSNNLYLSGLDCLMMLEMFNSYLNFLFVNHVNRMATAILDFMNAQNCKIGKEPSSSVNFKPDFR